MVRSSADVRVESWITPQIARDWNTKREPFAGYLSRFSVNDAYIAEFETHRVWRLDHGELWILAEEVTEFNSHMESVIAVESGFFGHTLRGEVPKHFMLEGRSADEQLRTLPDVLKHSGMELAQCRDRRQRVLATTTGSLIYAFCCREDREELSVDS